MTSAQDFKALRDAQAAVDPSMFLGRLCWYGVRQLSVNREDFCRLLITAKLRNFLPRPPQDSEIFRRVCTATRRTRIATSDPDAYANYLVRDVGHDKFTIFKRIVRETVNTRDRHLNHNSELCTVTFDKATAQVHVDCNFGRTTDVVAQQMADDIERGYKAERGHLDGYAVRELIRSVMNASNATNLRGKGGGLYFVSEVHAVHLDGLELLAATTNKMVADASGLSDRISFNTHGLFDDKKQRLMLRKAYESEMVTTINGAIAEITALISEAEAKGTKIPATKSQPHLAALRDAKSKDKEYAGLLSTGMTTSAARIKIYQALVLKATTLQ